MTGHGTIRRIKKYIPVYALMLPAIIYFIIFKYIPMAGIVVAFKDVSAYDGVAGIIAAPWVGLKHFIRFFNSYYFGNLLSNTLLISLKKLIIGFPAPIIFALLLNEIESLRFKKLVQTISYMPHFLSMVIVAGLVTSVLSTNGGIVNEIIKLFGGTPIFFMGRPEYFQGILVISSVWQGVGWGTIIYLAAMTGIDPALYEVATIDGASRLQRVLYITLPSISHLVVMMLIMRLGSILDAGFEQILLLYSQAVYSVGDIIDTYVYREGLINLKYSFSTAVGLFKSVIGIILVAVTNWVAHRFGQQGIW